mgnify:CR=1 FL=1
MCEKSDVLSFLGKFFAQWSRTDVLRATFGVLRLEIVEFIDRDDLNDGQSLWILCSEHANRVFICTTYGLFTEGMDKFDAYYEKGWIDKVITTNLNYRIPELLTRPYYVEANMSKYLASIMDIINHDVSVEKVRSSNEKIMDLMKRVNQ